MRYAVVLLSIAGVLSDFPIALAKGYGTGPTPAALAAKALNKPKLTIYTGSGPAGQYFQQAILADARVRNLQKEYDVIHGKPSEALSKGFKSLTGVLVSGRGGSIYKYEGSFRHVEDFIAFVIAAKAGLDARHLQGDALTQ